MTLGSNGNHAHLNTSFGADERAQQAKMCVAKPGFDEEVLKSILSPLPCTRMEWVKVPGAEVKPSESNGKGFDL